MSWEYYVIPSLFWVGAAIIGVGLVVAIGMAFKAAYDIYKISMGSDND